MRNIKLSDYQHDRIHFIGIGGCSMSGLALILKNLGFNVTGSDIRRSAFTKKLTEENIPFVIGHSEDNIKDPALIVYSAAIRPDNAEYQKAAQLKLPMLERSALLGILSGEYDIVAGIAGCHGKTTITSMVAIILEETGTDATVHVGGMVDFLGGGARLGHSNVFITEACEYVESFLKLSPTHAVVNNIDDDHLDYYRDIDEIYAAFKNYVQLLPKDGVLFGCGDDPLTLKLLNESTVNTITYGISAKNDWTVANISFSEDGNPSFDVIRNGATLGRIALNIPGEYNMINALAAVCFCHEIFNVAVDDAARALFEYRLAGRRFELLGEKNGIRVIHDYAHHPSEIEACLKAAKHYPHRKLWVVFQCNSYTRAKTLKDKFAKSFSVADKVIVADIYPGRDTDKGEIHARDLSDAIARYNRNTVYIATFDEIGIFLEKNAHPGDIVVTLGSGSVNKESLKLLGNSPTAIQKR